MKAIATLGILLSGLLSVVGAQAQMPTLEIKVDGFKNESELGIVSSHGNSNSDSYNFKQQDGFKWDANTAKLQYRYLRTSSNGVESARNWDAGLRYERLFGEALSGYAGQSVESDTFAGYDPRLNTDVGAKYGFTKTDTLTWNGEAGYRYSDEKRVTPPNAWSHYLRAYTEVEYKIGADSNTKFWIEYLPNITHNEAYLLNGEASITSILNSLFSLKAAYSVKFNHSPPPGIAQTTDTLFTTSLVARF